MHIHPREEWDTPSWCFSVCARLFSLFYLCVAVWITLISALSLTLHADLFAISLISRMRLLFTKCSKTNHCCFHTYMHTYHMPLYQSQTKTHTTHGITAHILQLSQTHTVLIRLKSKQIHSRKRDSAGTSFYSENRNTNQMCFCFLIHQKKKVHHLSANNC